MISIVTQKHHASSWGIVARRFYHELGAHGYDVNMIDFNHPPIDAQGSFFFIPVEWTIGQYPKMFRYYAKRATVMWGFLDCLSNTPGYVAQYVANTLDVALLTAEKCREIWSNYLADVYTHVVHLCIPNIYEDPPKEPRNPIVREIAEIKGTKILVFAHNDLPRKNLDIVYTALFRAIKNRKNVYVVIRVSDITMTEAIPYIGDNVRIIHGTLSEEDMVDLYDNVDLLIIPSGAGACELPAVEAAARGVPVIVSSYPVFMEYVPHGIQVPCTEQVTPNYHPYIHRFTMGSICRINENMLEAVIENVLDSLDSYKKMFDSVKKVVVNKFSCRSVVRRELIPVIEVRNLDL